MDNNDYKLPDQIYDEDGKFDSKLKNSVLTKRYEDEIVVVNDQELWEAEQQRNSTMKLGVLEKDNK